MFSLNRQVEVTQLMTQLPNQYNRSDSLKLVFEKRKTKRVFCITTNRLLKKKPFFIRATVFHSKHRYII